MTVMIAMALIGAVLGGVIARRRKGSGADIAQYAAVYAIVFALVGMVAALVLHRLLV